MRTSNRAWLFSIILVIIVAGMFVGLAMAHDDGDNHDEREMDHAHDGCERMHDSVDSPMMGGMMAMGDNCPMNSESSMMSDQRG